jgi:glucose-6-phosphate 1-epimerase
MNPGGDTADIYLHGAHVTSWKKNGEEVLFTSDRAVFDGKKAIRGGIPIIFPQFSDLGDLPSHGFARNMKWMVKEAHYDPAQEEVSITLVLDRRDEQTAKWPHREFELLHRITLGKELTSTLEFTNLGMQEVQFTNAFHTYFQVKDIAATWVEGLKGRAYLDQLEGRSERQEVSSAIGVTGEVDRIYRAVPNELKIVDSAGDREILLLTEQCADAVLWNPWIDKSQRMVDLGNEEYKKMICLEAGNVLDAVRVGPQETWTGTQRISIQ